jgi:hypothetical protein
VEVLHNDLCLHSSYPNLVNILQRVAVKLAHFYCLSSSDLECNISYGTGTGLCSSGVDVVQH